MIRFTDREKPFVIGMVHARPLPGSYRYESGDMSEITDIAVEEAKTLEANGVDGLQVENMWDFPYARGEEIGPETVAGLTAVSQKVKDSVSVPIGINCHLNGGLQALAVAEAVGAQWIRVFSWVNGYISNVGYIEGIANEVLDLKKKLVGSSVTVFADIMVKHGSHVITEDRTLAERCEDAANYQADAVIVTGEETGKSPAPESVADLKTKSELPVLVGSGLTAENISKYSDHIDGCIVGSYFKENGKWDKPVSGSRVKKFVNEV
ncbi:BtpA/SgcQ family protein [Candidatus Bipolaricaulota bacterium]|nr:BtpA/SgcQ family protein [Candidatus Bipolaricaulota bacterium]